MKIYKMPKNYMICECGCEFEFDCDDVKTLDLREPIRYGGGELIQNFIQFVRCVYCKSEISLDKAIENPHKSLDKS